MFPSSLISLLASHTQCYRTPPFYIISLLACVGWAEEICKTESERGAGLRPCSARWVGGCKGRTHRQAEKHTGAPRRQAGARGHTTAQQHTGGTRTNALVRCQHVMCLFSLVISLPLSLSLFLLPSLSPSVSFSLFSHSLPPFFPPFFFSPSPSLSQREREREIENRERGYVAHPLLM